MFTPRCRKRGWARGVEMIDAHIFEIAARGERLNEGGGRGGGTMNKEISPTLNMSDCVGGGNRVRGPVGVECIHGLELRLEVWAPPC